MFGLMLLQLFLNNWPLVLVFSVIVIVNHKLATSL